MTVSLTPRIRHSTIGGRLPLALFACLCTYLYACAGDDDTSKDTTSKDTSKDAGKDSTENTDTREHAFVLDDDFAADLQDMGVPEDAAKFLASAELEVLEAGPDGFRFLQTFPNGASREIQLSFDLDTTYAPTEADFAAAKDDGVEVFDVSYASSEEKGVVKTTLQYFVPEDAIPDDVLEILHKPSSVKVQGAKAALKGTPGTDTPGATFYIQETAKKGAEAEIGSLLDFFKEKGIKGAGLLSSIFGIMSAISDVTQSIDVAKENNGWQASLRELHGCAEHPTNPLSKSDPNYSKDTADKITAAQSELTQVNAVRFLNMMTDTASGANPALSVLLKAGFSWNDQALKKYSTDTILHEANAAVVACAYPFEAKVTFDFSNSYEMCGDICYMYTQQLKMSSSFTLDVTPFEGYILGKLDSATVSLTDSDTLTDKRDLNPPYHVSNDTKVDGTPMMMAGGGATPADEGVPIQDAADLFKGVKYVEVMAMLDVPTSRTRVEVSNVNNVPTTQTLHVDTDVFIDIGCKFNGVDGTKGGDYIGEITSMGPFSNAGPESKTARSSCTITLTPIMPDE